MTGNLRPGQLPASYEEATHQHLVYYSRITCVLAMALVAGGVGLDAAFYPEHSHDFGLARLVVVALIGAALWSYRGGQIRLNLIWLVSRRFWAK